MENKYYVYERFRKDNDTCFYVGRGHGNRYKDFHRNKLHDEIATKYGYYTKIYKDSLTSEESCELEKERIKYYVSELNYGIDIFGYNDNLDNNVFLTNRSFGGEDGYFKSGKLNPQYGITPKQRMGSNYDEWLKKRSILSSGKNNPNYGNDTLKKKLQQHPELKKLYYSRKGSQNGRARSVEMYDKDWNFISKFDTIGECCEYIKEKYNVKSKIASMRSNLSISARENKTYLGFYFKFI